jgi:ABC-type multidrug transport system permease subunit
MLDLLLIFERTGTESGFVRLPYLQEAEAIAKRFINASEDDRVMFTPSGEVTACVRQLVKELGLAHSRPFPPSLVSALGQHIYIMPLFLVFYFLICFVFYFCRALVKRNPKLLYL